MEELRLAKDPRTESGDKDKDKLQQTRMEKMHRIVHGVAEVYS